MSMIPRKLSDRLRSLNQRMKEAKRLLRQVDSQVGGRVMADTLTPERVQELLMRVARHKAVTDSGADARPVSVEWQDLEVLLRCYQERQKVCKWFWDSSTPGVFSAYVSSCEPHNRQTIAPIFCGWCGRKVQVTR